MKKLININDEILKKSFESRLNRLTKLNLIANTLKYEFYCLLCKF